MGKFGQNREFLKIPRFKGFWDFPREQKKIPTGSSNSLDLGKIPRSGHTGCFFPGQENKLDAKHDILVASLFYGPTTEIQFAHIYFYVPSLPTSLSYFFINSNYFS